MMTQSKTTSARGYAQQSALVTRFVRLFTVWSERHRARRALARLDEHMLRDIGLSQNEARREVARRFWQD